MRELQRQRFDNGSTISLAKASYKKVAVIVFMSDNKAIMSERQNNKNFLRDSCVDFFGGGSENDFSRMHKGVRI